MPSYNELTIVGHLGRDPEMRFTPDGMPVTTFSVAVNDKIKDKEITTWFNVVAFGKQAESCNEFLTKGQLAMVVGRVRLDQWEGSDGQMRSKLQVTANRVVFLTRSKDYGSEDSPEEEEIFGNGEETPEDLPF